MFKKNQGFTLLELMVVVVILGILASFIVPKLIDRPNQAKRVKAVSDIATIESALELYNLDNGRFPTTDQSLQALVKKPSIAPIPKHWKQGGYIKKLTKDPWGNDYQYLNPGVHETIDIFSYGPDGNDSDEEEIIGNWDDETKGQD